MRSIFRLFRLREISSSKIRTYFFYAIGEIVLVVIGILIAIQIDNWNRSRKNQKLEVEILQEIKNGLIYDISDLTWDIDVHKKAIESSRYVIDVMKTNKPYTDSLGIHFSRCFFITFSFFDFSPYENLKSRGFGLIKNDSIRRRISTIYEAMHISIYKYEDQAEPIREIMYQFAVNNFDGVKNFSFGEVDYPDIMIPNDYTQLKNNKEFRSILQSRITNHRSFNFFMNRSKEYIEKTLKMIDDELERIK